MANLSSIQSTFVAASDERAGVYAFAAKEHLKSVGWTVQASGDGLAAFSSSGDIITGNGSGANGFDNALAWVRLQRPDGQAEFTLQLQGGGTTAGARIKYGVAADGLFTGGSPSATQTPSAVGEQFVAGGGTDAAPTWEDFFSDIVIGGGTINYVIFATADADAPYGFWFARVNDWETSSTYAPSWCWAYDPVELPQEHEGQDPEPYVHHVPISVSIGAYSETHHTSNTSSLVKVITWYDKDGVGTGPGWVRCHFGPYTNWGDHRVTGHITGGRPLCPLWYERDDSNPNPSGIKGYSTMFRAFMPVQTSSARNHTYTVRGVTNALIRIGDYAMVWDGQAVTIPASPAYTTENGVYFTATDTLVSPDSGFQYVMRANDDVTGATFYWKTTTVDTLGASYPGPNSPLDIVVSDIIGD